jgi:hypothetical protein
MASIEMLRVDFNVALTVGLRRSPEQREWQNLIS